MSGMLREWFSAAELAALKLKGAPGSKRGWNKQIDAAGWEHRVDTLGRPLCRERRGVGGGREFHWSLLPPWHQDEMVRRGIVVDKTATPPASTATTPDAQEYWARFEAASDAAKARARKRFDAMVEVETLCAGGMVQDTALSMVANRLGVSRSSLFNWRERLLDGKRADWLALLLDEQKGGGKKADIHPELWAFYKSWWLRQSKPTFTDAYRRTVREAARLGITDVPGARTFQRRAQALPPEVIALKRGGVEAARLLQPAVERSVAGMHAMQLVNADGHKWDVRVRFPDGSIGRPITVAIQDVYSRKFLAWRHGKSEDALTVRMAFVDLFRRWGFPEAVLTDNGRAFASKWITGGTDNRYRYSILPGDPLGLLPRFGITVHWAMPARGSSKPIERGFRDWASDISRHPAFDGAWIGNSVANKPENYGSRVIEYEDFRRIIEQEIGLHNARSDRKTEMAQGRSFDEVFAESYAEVPIQKATESQLRLSLLSADKVRADRQTGTISFLGNRYWNMALSRYAGKPLIIRYDPEDLHSEIHVYDSADQFIGTVPIWEKSGFLTEDRGRARMKLERDYVKSARKQAELEQLISANELARRAEAHGADDDDASPAPTVIRPVRVRGNTALAVRPETQATETSEAFVDRFANAVRLRLVDD